MTRLTITIDETEFAALQQAAIKQMRPVRDQARYIIRSVLLGEPMPVVSRKNADEQSEAQPCST